MEAFVAVVVAYLIFRVGVAVYMKYKLLNFRTEIKEKYEISDKNRG